MKQILLLICITVAAHFCSAQSSMSRFKGGNGDGFGEGKKLNTTLNDCYLAGFDLGDDIVVCSGDSVSLTAEEIFAQNFSWSTGEITQSIYAKNAGTYIVTATRGACSFTDSVHVFIHSLTASFISDSTSSPYVSDGSSAIAITSGAGPYDYLWSTGDTTNSIENVSGGNYSVNVQDELGCTATFTVTIFSKSCPAITADITTINTSSPYLSDGSVAVDIISDIPPFVYVWNNASTGPELTNVPAGDYSVLVTNSLGCQQTFTATVANTPCASMGTNFTIQNASSPVQNDGSVVLNIESGTGPFSYLWSNGSTNSGLTDIAAGNYSVSVKNGLGCSETFSATVPLAPCYHLCNVQVTNITTAKATITWQGPAEATYKILLRNLNTNTQSSIGTGHALGKTVHIAPGADFRFNIRESCGGTVYTTPFYYFSSPALRMIDDNTMVTADIFPNPAETDISILLHHCNAGIVQVAVYSLTGQLVYSTAWNRDNEEMLHIDVSNYEKGMYIVQLHDDTNLYPYKFVKN